VRPSTAGELRTQLVAVFPEFAGYHSINDDAYQDAVQTVGI
jgi:hypothetical protein